MTTTAIKAAIIDALEAANIETTPATLAAVYHCFMETGCGLDVDIEDAIQAAAV
tara:strand:+ start:166 stop:327 length:162 start_codon:yes stop_codon:yes gene_type:complete